MKDYYHHIIEVKINPINSKSVPLKWKLLDHLGQDLGLVFLNGSLTTTEFTLQVENNGSMEKYIVYCDILAYPRALPIPQAYFSSFETFRIYADYSRSSRFYPKVRCRIQGTENWNLLEKKGTDPFTATIKHKDDVYEVQAFYEINGEPFLSSPILVVDRHWQRFDMKKHCNIDLEQLSLKKIFCAKFGFHQEDLIATIRSIDTDGVLGNEIELKKENSSTTNWGYSSHYTNFTSSVLLPGQYQVKFTAKKYGINFTHNLTVAGDGKETWPKNFGSNLDAVTFSLSTSELREDDDYYGGPVEVVHYFHRKMQLLSKGQYKYDKTETYHDACYGQQQNDEIGFSGKFRIIEENQFRAVLGLHPESKRIGPSSFRPREPLSESISKDINDQLESPAAFLPEIINKIASALDARSQSNLRFVCKKWLNAIPLTITVVVTSTKCAIDDWRQVLNRE